MSALAYRARKERIEIRIVAYRPYLTPVPEDHLRVVVQAVEHGRPIAEDPLHIEVMPVLELAQALHISRNEGWDIQPWEDNGNGN